MKVTRERAGSCCYNNFLTREGTAPDELQRIRPHANCDPFDVEIRRMLVKTARARPGGFDVLAVE
jgi:hypothetical protein